MPEVHSMQVDNSQNVQKEMNGPSLTFSIITATHNRVRLLERVFRSLEAQTFKDFEWIVVDDGSTDDTPAVVNKLMSIALFPICYLRKINGGKTAAVNYGMTIAKGYFIGIQDDDDWYFPNALERCWSRWQEIADEKKNEYVGLAALGCYPDGRVVGERFSQDILDSDSIDIRCVHHKKGDHKSFLRADVLRRYPFPETIGGIPESLVWNRIAMRYKTRYIDEVWSYFDYQPDGMSASFHSCRKASALGMWLSAKELLLSGRRFPLWFTIRTQANFVRYRLHDHACDSRSVHDVFRGTFPVGAAIGVGAFVKDALESALSRLRSAFNEESPPSSASNSTFGVRSHE